MSDRTTALLRRTPRFVATALAALLVFGGLGVRLVALQFGDGGSGGGRVGVLPKLPVQGLARRADTGVAFL